MGFDVVITSSVSHRQHIYSVNFGETVGVNWVQLETITRQSSQAIWLKLD
jgi:hypothetical protein